MDGVSYLTDKTFIPPMLPPGYEPFTRRKHTEVVLMKHLGRVHVAQACLARFFALKPAEMWIVDASVNALVALPGDLEFVMDWAGFKAVSPGSLIPLYYAKFVDDKLLFEQAY